jgi:arsenite-transporting ATPase
VPEEMILIDTQNAAELFLKFDVPLSGYIVNRVLPDLIMSEAGVPDYLRSRYKMQGEYLEKIDNMFGDQVLARVPEFERDITGMEMIERMAEAMFGD